MQLPIAQAIILDCCSKDGYFTRHSLDVLLHFAWKKPVEDAWYVISAHITSRFGKLFWAPL